MGVNFSRVFFQFLLTFGMIYVHIKIALICDWMNQIEWNLKCWLFKYITNDSPSFVGLGPSDQVLPPTPRYWKWSVEKSQFRIAFTFSYLVFIWLPYPNGLSIKVEIWWQKNTDMRLSEDTFQNFMSWTLDPQKNYEEMRVRNHLDLTLYLALGHTGSQHLR